MSNSSFQPTNNRATPMNYFNELQPEDIAFYEQVKAHVTGSHALPFSIPAQAFLQIVSEAMKFFWTWYPMATEEISYYIPNSEIFKYKRGTGYGLRLPFSVEDVFGWHVCSRAYNPALVDFLRWNHVQTYLSSSVMGAGNATGAGGSFRNAAKAPMTSVSNMVIQMYEFESYSEMFSRVVAASFNNNTSILTLRGDMSGASGLVVDVFERVPPEALYDNWDFKQYVIACVEEALGRIVMAFDFPLIGDVKINYDEIKARGQEKKEKIEESLQENANHDIILFKK